MKEAILSTLASEDPQVRSQVANVISAIASIEIPRKEWDSLINNLCLNAANMVYNVRLASLTTLGYICEEIHPDDINDDLKNLIIIALSNNIGASQKAEDVEPCRLASKALIYSVPFASQNFKVSNERDYIMDKLF
jgi:importin subunit beta-1